MVGTYSTPELAVKDIIIAALHDEIHRLRNQLQESEENLRFSEAYISELQYEAMDLKSHLVSLNGWQEI